MRLLSSCLLVLALVGCGDDGDGEGGGGSVSTGLPEDKVLSEVSADEAQDLCDSLAESSANAISERDLAKLPCTIAALSNPANVMVEGDSVTIDREACQAEVDECLQNPPDSTETEECDPDALMAQLAD